MDVLLVSRSLLSTSTSRPAFSLRGIPLFHTEITTLSCVTCYIEIHVLAYFLPAEQPDVFTFAASSSLRARVCASYQLCVRKYVCTCVHSRPGPPIKERCSPITLNVFRIPKEF